MLSAPVLIPLVKGMGVMSLEAWMGVVAGMRSGLFRGAVRRRREMRGRFRILLLLVGLLLVPALLPVLAAERVALVVGNAAYEQEIAALKNPVNDAAAVAAALRRLGFEVMVG